MKPSALGLDRAIAITLLNRGWGVLAGPVSLVFIVAHLSPEEQGFYFTMGSMLGLQVLFELGLSFVVLQTVSHMVPALKLVNGHPSGEPAAVARLGRFLRDLVGWYLLIALLFVGSLALGGSWFLARSAGADQVQWEGAWLLALAFFGANILCNAVFSVVEGLGLVAQVAMGRLLQSVVAMCALWLGLGQGLDLLALALMHLASFAAAALWLSLRHGQLLMHLLRHAAGGERVDWRHDMWPFQWRIALSWMAGYLGSQAIVPIVFATMGAAAAGRIGLSITVMTAASAAALAWVTTKSPSFGRLVAERNYAGLDQLFGSAYNLARVMACVATGAVLLLVGLLHLQWPQHAARFVPLAALGLLALATVFNVQTSAQAIYLRAFRREPFLAVSVASGLALTGSALLLSRLGDLTLVIGGYATITALIALAWSGPLFHRCRAEYTRTTPA